MYNLTDQDSFLNRFRHAILECWDKPAIEEYKSSSITYGELAAELDKTVQAGGDRDT